MEYAVVSREHLERLTTVLNDLRREAVARALVPDGTYYVKYTHPHPSPSYMM